MLVEVDVAGDKVPDSRSAEKGLVKVLGRPRASRFGRENRILMVYKMHLNTARRNKAGQSKEG